MCNVGGIDRAIRIIAGIFLLSLVFIGDQIIGQNVVWGWIGIVPLATGLIGWCPPYALLGINSCGVKN